MLLDPLPPRVAPISLQQLAVIKSNHETEAKRIVFAKAAHGGASLSQDDIDGTTFTRKQRYRQSPPTNMIATGSYDLTKMVFSICANQARTNGANDTQNGNAILATHIGLVVNQDCQRATYQELLNKGRFSIQGPQGSNFQNIDNRPLSQLLVADGNQVGVETVALDGDDEPATLRSGMAAFGEEDLWELSTPMLIKSAQSGKLILDGLSGTVAGSTPTLTFALVIFGEECVGLTK